MADKTLVQTSAKDRAAIRMDVLKAIARIREDYNVTSGTVVFCALDALGNIVTALEEGAGI